MSPFRFQEDADGHVFHLSLKTGLSVAGSLIGMIAVIASAFWWFWTTSAEAVTAWNRMQSTMAQNTSMLGEIKRQMATDKNDGNRALVVATGTLSEQIGKINDRTDRIEDRTRSLEINQARVLEALKRQGIVEKGNYP